MEPPQYMGPHTCTHAVWGTVTKLCVVIKLGPCEENVTALATQCALGNIFDTNVQHDLFAVADLVNFTMVIA